MAAAVVEIRSRRRGDARFGQHAAGEIERIVGEARNRGVDVEGAVDRKQFVEADGGKPRKERLRDCAR